MDIKLKESCIKELQELNKELTILKLGYCEKRKVYNITTVDKDKIYHTYDITDVRWNFEEEMKIINKYLNMSKIKNKIDNF